jgi:hypothetical protein
MVVHKRKGDNKMIDIKKILKRSWHILWNYRILWVFGFLLAVTGAGGGGNSGSGYQAGNRTNNNGSNGNNSSFLPGSFLGQLSDWFNQNVTPVFSHPEQYVATFIWIGVALLLFILVVAVVTSLIRYPSETAVLRMVDDYEQTGTKAGFRQGWKLGWNRRAFRIWVIDLVVGLPVFLLVALLTGLGVAGYLSFARGSNALGVSVMIAAIGCAFLFIFAFVILMVILGLLRQFFVRAAALEGAGIGESFRLGWAMVRKNWKSVGLMWLVMIGIGIAYGIIGIVLFLLLIPAYILLVLPAALVAAVPALLALAITSIFAAGPLAWIVTALVAIPFFFMVLFAPLAVISGWYVIYTSSVWTLTYREIKALAVIEPEEIPAKIA